MQERTQLGEFLSALRRRPDAMAHVRGSRKDPGLTGTVRFYQTRQGVLVAAEVMGLPESRERCKEDIFGFHIHSGARCTGDVQDPFADALGHYNPGDCPHPAHAGDLPPLFADHGRAFQVVLTDRFSVREVVWKTVIIHARPDDFTSQPGGAAGARLACGEIRWAGAR